METLQSFGAKVLRSKINSILLRAKNFFFSYNVDPLMVLADCLINKFCYILKVIWYKRKNMKLDIAINYVAAGCFLMSVH